MAPLAVNVALLPTHMAVGLDVALNVGVGVTCTVTVLVLRQPVALAPVTVYTVVDSGLTVTVAPVKLPGIQVYVTAPLAVNVVLLPEHMLADDAEAVIVGFGFTVKLSVRVLTHIPLAPTKVYVVLTVGDTTTVDVVDPPGNQV